MLCAEIEAVNFESWENIGKCLYFIHVSLNLKKRAQTLGLSAIIHSVSSQTKFVALCRILKSQISFLKDTSEV